VTSADLVLPALGGHAPPAVVLTGPGDGEAAAGPLEPLLARVSAALDAHGHVVALVPASLPVPERRRLHAARAILETDRLALVETDLPPLASALLALQLRHLCATELGPGVIAGAARLLSYYLHAGAVLNSVTRLDRVQVDLKSHLRSWVPGAQFAVLAHPAPRLVELSGSARVPGPDYLTDLAVGEAGLRVDWVKGDLARQWRCRHVHEVPLPAASARWWGNQRLVEFAAHIPDPRVLHQLVTSVRRDPCGWCGLEIIGDECLFCSAPLEHRAEHRPHLTGKSDNEIGSSPR
jgi:hypothetical protein